MSSTSYTTPYCHRCGKPGANSYVGGQPTCEWCMAELEKARGPYQLSYTPSSTTQYLYVDAESQQLYVKVKYAIEDLEPLEYVGHGISDWVDLRVAEEVFLKAGEFRLISLGVSIELPKGYEAIIAPRSSTFKHWGILQANSIGIVDESYCGNNDVWHWAAYATKDVQLHKNDRVCQFRIIKHQPQLIFQTVENLENTDRSGFLHFLF